MKSMLKLFYTYLDFIQIRSLRTCGRFCRTSSSRKDEQFTVQTAHIILSEKKNIIYYYYRFIADYHIIKVYNTILEEIYFQERCEGHFKTVNQTTPAQPQIRDVGIIYLHNIASCR